MNAEMNPFAGAPQSAGAAGPTSSSKAAQNGISQGAEAAAPPPATGLASLDFELPTRGVLVRFTVPRGEAEITARAFSSDLWQRFWQLALVAFAALLIWSAASWALKGGLAWLAKPAGSTLLICLGLLSVFTLMPLLGLAAMATGCGLKARRHYCQNG